MFHMYRAPVLGPYTYMHTCICASVCIRLCAHVHLCVHLYMRASVHSCCVQTRIYVCSYTHTPTGMCVHVYPCLLTRAYVCKCTYVCMYTYAVCVLSVTAQKSRSSTAALDVTGDQRLGSYTAGTTDGGCHLGSVAPSPRLGFPFWDRLPVAAGAGHRGEPLTTTCKVPVLRSTTGC